MQRRAESRMTRKRQLFRDRENADFLPFLSFNRGIARKNESCLGKIHLTRERLHFVVVQSARVGENRERITGQRCLRENVNLNEFVTAFRHKNHYLISASCRSCPKRWNRLEIPTHL